MPTLTSTGAVNLTSSTNWSPASVPTDGDTLILASGHTLTIDKDITLVQLTVNDSLTSRMVVSGTTPRTLTVTNQILYSNRAGGNDPSAANNTYFCQVGSGQSLTIIGKHSVNVSSDNSNMYAVSSGTLRLLATTAADELYRRTNGIGYMTVFIRATNSVLETRGIINVTIPSGSSSDGLALIRLVSGVTYTHNHAGTMNYPGNTGILFCGGTSTITWTGDTIYSGTLNSLRWFRFDGNGINVFFNGTHYQSSGFSGYGNPLYFNSAGGTLTITGLLTTALSTRMSFLSFGTANVVYRDQSLTIPSNHLFTIGNNTSVNISGLQLTVYGFASFGGIASFTIDANTRVNVMSGGQGSSTVSNIPIIYTPDPAPVLPAASDVANGVVYGYAASPITGTGLIVDPLVLSAAITDVLQDSLAPNAPTVVERSIEDEKPITFSWPATGATITGQKSIDGGTYSAVEGNISFLRTEGDRHYYTLAYNVNDRTDEEATIRYKMTDGTYTKYFNLNIKPIFVSGTTASEKVLVNQDYGGTSKLTYVLRGRPISDATIEVFLYSDYLLGRFNDNYRIDRTRQRIDGTWEKAFYLDPEEYAIRFVKANVAGPDDYYVVVSYDENEIRVQKI